MPVQSPDRLLRILIRRGDNLNRVFIVKDQDGSVLDLSGWSAKLSVKLNETDSSVLISKSSTDASEIDIHDPTNGKLRVYFVPADTSSLTPRTYVYDLQLTSVAGKVYTTHKSTFSVLYDITP